MSNLVNDDNQNYGASVPGTPDFGQIFDVKMCRGEIVISGRCTANTQKQAVLIAKIGEEIARIEVLTVSNDVTATHSATVNFEIAIPRQELNRHDEALFTLILVNESYAPFYASPCNSVIERAERAEEAGIYNVFPSFGFYGGGKDRPLEININDTVKGVKLVVEQSSAFVNLAKLEIFDSSGQVIAPGPTVSVTCSSRLNEKIAVESLIQGQGFHSLREDNPWYQIEFASETDLKSLKVYNRRDKFGARSKGLVVYTLNQQDEWVPVYSGLANKDVAAALKSELEQNLSAADYSGCYSGSSLCRDNVVDKVLTHCSQNIANATLWSVGFIEQLLPTWSLSKIDDFDIDREVNLLALLIFKQTFNNLSFQLLPFSKILHSKHSITQCQNYVNKYRKAQGLQEIQFTKHGIALHNKLTENPERIIDSTKMLMSDLNELGVKPCIAYGTLLGAVREGAFISHDDDVDLLIELPERNITKEKALDLAEETMSRLDAEKYRVVRASKTGKNINLHVRVLSTGVVLDVFPYWYKDEMAMLHMESMKIRGIPASIMEGRNKIKFYDKTFYTPEHPERFLVERYGSEWQNPDPFHEWRWELN